MQLYQIIKIKKFIGSFLGAFFAVMLITVFIALACQIMGVPTEAIRIVFGLGFGIGGLIGTMIACINY